MMVAGESQLASTVLMIRPVRFESNPETAESNRFQGRNPSPAADQQRQAVAQFDALAEALTGAGVNVVVVEDTADPHTPDSIFPNNWVSFHADGRVVLYPMEAKNRRGERRLDVIEKLDLEHGFHVSEVVDLSSHEDQGHYLEGTGSMVLDRENRIAYACVSTRTHLDPLGDFAQRLDYEAIAFDAVDRNGVPIYHTNVLMNVGEELAVICSEALPRVEQRDSVLARLRDTGHEVIEIGFDQLDAFAGNMLELRAGDNVRVVAMSKAAWNSLNEEQQQRFEANGRVVAVDIGDIESSAGGSVRCMLAEVHLPLR